MSKIYDFNNLKRNNNNKFDIKLLPIAIVTYVLGYTGALVVLLFSRHEENKLVAFHAAQSMLISLLFILARTILSSIHLLNDFTFNILLFLKILFVIVGTLRLVMRREFYLPYISEVSSRFIW